MLIQYLKGTHKPHALNFFKERWIGEKTVVKIAVNDVGNTIDFLFIDHEFKSYLHHHGPII